MYVRLCDFKTGWPSLAQRWFNLKVACINNEGHKDKTRHTPTKLAISPTKLE